MSLGQAQTNRFQIGTAELRVGALSAARKLTQAHSVGLVDEVKVSYSRETAQLKGGFPTKLVDETPISEMTTLTATLREYSRKNLGILLGRGNLAATYDFSSSVTAIAGAAATPVLTITNSGAVSPSTIFAVDDVVTCYVVGRPELVFVATVLDADATSIDLTAIDSDLYTEIDDAIGDGATVKVFKASVINVGDIAQTQYFAVSLVQKDLKSGRPIIFNFWKVSAKGGMDYATNASDYASTELSLEVLEPTVADYATGGDLDHLATIIPNAPMYEMVNSADVIV